MVIADGGLAPLREALGVRLTLRSWERFGILVGSLEAAWSAGDDVGFTNSVERLDLALRKRAARLGEEPAVPMTQPVRERVNRMIHVLTDASGEEIRRREAPPEASATADAGS
ncbi:CATRA system-associated protein [Frankia tisae]|uniref:CATRA system-associated protein n=1 Tax=Frankia tisae TaxID=2950104 RepID=UPI0021BF9995|nr:CATRA system-associated protein [Frankia tisae]